VKRVILDTGPLVAWFCPRDEHHVWASQAFAQIKPGAFVCEAVLAEVCHLVAKEGVRPGKVLEFVASGGLVMLPLGGELGALRMLLDHYADAPMDFADACVVRLAELNLDATVCTTDGHFRFFRRKGSQNIPLLAPFAV
jgi:uncharacterized protein